MSYPPYLGIWDRAEAMDVTTVSLDRTDTEGPKFPPGGGVQAGGGVQDTYGRQA
jgi:hypothetical protein